MTFQTVSSFAELTRLIEKTPTICVFKHSSTCPTSARAHSEVELFMEGNPEIPVVLVVVQEQRSISDDIALTTGIRHESPQFFIYKGGSVLEHTSHFAITADWIKNNQ